MSEKKDKKKESRRKLTTRQKQGKKTVNEGRLRTGSADDQLKKKPGAKKQTGRTHPDKRLEKYHIHSEKALEQQTAELWHSLVETSAAWIWQIDAQLRHIYTNAFVTTCLGYQPEEFMRIDIFDLIHPDDHVRVKEIVQNASIRHAGWVDQVLRWRHKDGSWRYIETSGSAVFDADGKFAGLRGVDRDITDRKRVEEALRQSEERFRALTESTSDWIWEVDENTRYTYASPKVRDLLGYEPQEIIGKTPFDFMHREEAERVAEEFFAYVKDGKPFTCIINANIHKGGHLVILETSGVPLFNDEGKVRGYRGIDRDITGRRQAEEALRESEGKYRTLFESSTDAIFILDLDGNFIDVNRNAHERLGYTKEELLALHISQLDTPEFAARVPERLAQIRERGAAVFESAHVRKDGSIMPVEVNSHLLDYGGEKVYFSIIRDISDRKRVEEAMCESEYRMRSIVESLPIGMHLYHLEPDGRLLFTGANPAADRILGIDNRIFIGKTIETAFPGLVGTDVPRRYREAAASGKAWYTEQINYHEGAIHGAFEVYAFQTAPNTMVAAFEDITKRKQMEEALRESERSLKTLMGNLPGMAYRCRNDRNWTMEYISEGAVALTGYPVSDIIGNAKVSYNDLIHPDDQQAVWDAVQSAVGRRDKFTLNYRIQRADGQERSVWEQGQGVYSEVGDLLALEGFITDVTEHRLLEEERLKTQKLESIGTLAGGIAHDFNNLLQGVFGYISMAKMSLDRPERVKAMLLQAEEALHLSVNLTTQLLTFSRGGMPMKRLIRLQPVIENAVKFSLSGSHTDYLLDIPADLWPIEADEGQLAQVIQNITLNAHEAMAGRGTVKVSAGNRDMHGKMQNGLLEAGQFVRIDIEDSGTGIPEQNLKKIFDPYFTTKQRGSGLGLATSYSIIRNHGGVIEVKSELNHGSTFTIYLPAAQGGEMPEETIAPVVSARKGRILLMDDEELIRNVATEMIASLGHDVDSAPDGQQAIEMFIHASESGNPYNLVILDLTVRGGMGGEETIRKMREIDPDVVAVVSSGYSDNPVVAKYRAYGFLSFLNKPYKLAALRDCLNELLTQE